MNPDLSDFYAGKRVVVTGGAGMIGYQLVSLLEAAGADVVVLDNFSRGGNKMASPNVSYIPQGDATRLHTCCWAMRDAHAVFNLAATVAGVLHNQGHHLEMFQENVQLQTVPLMGAAEAGVPHFLQVSSVCVYAPDQNHPALEENGMVGEPHPANYGYAWSKRLGEKMASVSPVEHVVTVRPSNVFGVLDYFDSRAHVIPALIRKAIYDDEINVYGPRDTAREFIYSSDVAMGMMTALALGEHRGVYNVGCHGDNSLTLEQLVEAIQVATRTTDKEVIFHEGEGGGDPKRWSDCSRIHKLGWKHSIGLNEGLGLVVDWYRRKKNRG